MSSHFIDLRSCDNCGGRIARLSTAPQIDHLYAADTAIDASVRSSYAAFTALANDWAGKVRRWRCGLSGAERVRLGTGANWRCGDVTFAIDRVSFDQLGPARAGILNAIPTRFTLPADQVDLLIESGADALRQSKPYQAFRRGL